MSTMQRQELDGVLSRYVADHPKQATFTGDSFIIKPRRFGPLMMLAFAITALFMLLFVVGGLFMIVLGLIGDRVENRPAAVLTGLFLAAFGGGVIFFVVVNRLSRGVIDLRTGDYKMKSIFGSRQMVNMADVDSYNRLDQRMQSSAGGATVNVVCQLLVVVPGKRKPKTKKIPLAVFNKASGFDEFEPVVNALIGYYRTADANGWAATHHHG